MDPQQKYKSPELMLSASSYSSWVIFFLGTSAWIHSHFIYVELHYPKFHVASQVITKIQFFFSDSLSLLFADSVLIHLSLSLSLSLSLLFPSKWTWILLNNICTYSISDTKILHIVIQPGYKGKIAVQAFFISLKLDE